MQLHQPAVVGRQHHPRHLHLVQSRSSHSVRMIGLAAKKCLTDRNSFTAYAIKMGTPVPKTICVEKGNVLPHLVGFKYPLWIRASHGDRSFFCHNEADMKKAIRALHGQSYQLQESLLGFGTYRVLYSGNTAVVSKVLGNGEHVSFEEIKPSQREHVLAMGVTRRISDSVRTQGIGVICFDVAIRQETAYVTGCLL